MTTGRTFVRQNLVPKLQSETQTNQINWTYGTNTWSFGLSVRKRHKRTWDTNSHPCPLKSCVYRDWTWKHQEKPEWTNEPWTRSLTQRDLLVGILKTQSVSSLLVERSHELKPKKHLTQVKTWLFTHREPEQHVCDAVSMDTIERVSHRNSSAGCLKSCFFSNFIFNLISDHWKMLWLKGGGPWCAGCHDNS